MVEIHLTLRLRASPRVHDGAETPSTITLKQASTIAEMRTLITGHTELKTLQRYANLRPAILASKLDGVGMPKLA